MIFGLLSWHLHGEGKQLLTARIKSRDGSVVRAQLANVPLTFKTAFGETRIFLSRMRRMENVAHLDTLKDVAKLHRFRIFCTDGDELLGFPLSPGRIPVAIADAVPAWNLMRLGDILSLEILSPESFAVPEHALN